MVRTSRVVLLALLAFAACDSEKKEAPKAAPAPAPAAPVAAAPAPAPAAKPVEAPAAPLKPEEISVTASSPDAVTTFKRGRYLVENARIEEGVAELTKAAQADRKFPLALAYLGFFTPTEEGMAMLQRAVALSGDLPKPEKLYVEHLLTWRQGDDTLLREQRKSLAQLAPNDWRVHFELGVAARDDHNFSEAESQLQKALALNSNAGAAWNMLGLTLIEQGKYDDAVKALTKYAEQLPDEPAPYDSMGEALLRAGKLDDAEKQFTQAVTKVPAYTQAWYGVALCRFLKGDFNGGRKALTDGAAKAPGPDAALDAHSYIVWSHFAQKDWAGANGAITTLENAAAKAKNGKWNAQAYVLRAALMYEMGKLPAVTANVNAAMGRAQAARLSGDALSSIIGQGQLWTIQSLLKQKKLPQAEKSLELLGKAIQLAPGAETLSLRSHATGLISDARGDKDIAVQQLLECTETDYLCRVDLYRLQKETGSPAADKTKDAVLKSPRRDPLYLVAWTSLGGAAK